VRAEADGRSLLLLDELGTGTDPTEGAALGQALLKQLVQGERETGHTARQVI
jgi:dsDNA-specific endonuclease/ATPase MutS2